MSFRFLVGHRVADGVVSATVSAVIRDKVDGTNIGVNKLVDSCEDILVTRNVFKCIWTVFLDPADGIEHTIFQHKKQFSPWQGIFSFNWQICSTPFALGICIIGAEHHSIACHRGIIFHVHIIFVVRHRGELRVLNFCGKNLVRSWYREKRRDPTVELTRKSVLSGSRKHQYALFTGSWSFAWKYQILEGCTHRRDDSVL